MAMRSLLRGAWLCLLPATALVAAVTAAVPPGGTGAGQGHPVNAAQQLERLPLLFVPEQVAADGTMGFAVRGSQASVWLGERGLAYRLHPTSGVDSPPGGWVVALDLVGATPRVPVGEDLLPTKVSYFKGPRDQWRTGLPSYGSVVYREPWPGVDLVVGGTAGELESTFVVQPGADPGLIRLAYRGASSVRLEPDGSLIIDTPLGSITELAPFAYQEVDGRRVEVAAVFELEPGAQPAGQAYRFRLVGHDPSRELVIDPVTLLYCGYIGGSSDDRGYAIAVDGAGSAYVTGVTTSTQATFPVAVGPDLTHNGGNDVFVAKVNAAGTALDYCGYIGGAGNEAGYGIAVDGSGNAYVTGDTLSNQSSFPVIVGPDLTLNGVTDAFVAKVNAAGTALDYCGYIGGSGTDRGRGIAVDTSGRAYVSGGAESDEATFPVSVGPDLTHNGLRDAFVARVNGAGTALDYCGYIGGAGNENCLAIAVSAGGSAYVAGDTPSSQATFPVTVGPDPSYNGGGSDGFVAKVNAAGTALDYCGYIGGSDSDTVYGIAVDAAGSAYVAGDAISTQVSFPVAVGPDLTHNGYVDAYVAKVNAAGTGLAYCGYVGGSANDYGRAIALDGGGGAYLTGYTKSDEASFPVALGPDLTFNGGTTYGDAFVAKVAAAGTGLDYCGYIGGAGEDLGVGIAVDADFTATVTGYTTSTETSFPVTVGPDLVHSGGNDAFVARVSSSDFTLGATPPTREICAGETAQYTVTVGSIAGFTSPVTLSASGQPAGSTAGFSVNPVTPPGSSVLTIADTGGAAGGGYTVTITGTAGSVSHSAQVALDVAVIPAPPTLIAPPDGATDQPLRPTFQWTAVTGADSYGLEVDDSPAFGSPAISQTGILGTTFTPSSDLEEDTTYHWRARSENLCGAGVASAVFSFTTAALPLPGPFGKVAPADGASGQPTDPTLSWGTSAGATGYERCVDTVDDDACNASWVSVGNATSTLLGGLDQATTYFWQVQAVNAQGSTVADAGAWWHFTTQGGEPTLPFSDGFESGDTAFWSATVP
ncbi:MAG TPA: SBBP repeat-containing protein [Thermoanaerobaculales bacterium]|nr:SBBP repeat-containing protein [Thermoanaerobaculales bacterium]